MRKVRELSIVQLSRFPTRRAVLTVGIWKWEVSLFHYRETLKPEENQEDGG